MNNRIIYMSETEIKVIRNNLIRNQDVFVAEIDGELVKTEKDYVQSMINAFKFPFKLTQMKIGWCNDYLYDLSWIKQKIIILIVYNFKQMLTDEEEKKSNDSTLKSLVSSVLCHSHVSGCFVFWYTSARILSPIRNPSFIINGIGASGKTER